MVRIIAEVKRPDIQIHIECSVKADDVVDGIDDFKNRLDCIAGCYIVTYAALNDENEETN